MTERRAYPSDLSDATRRGRRYGTILVDCETHQLHDLLPDRDVDSVAAWLREHPSVQIVCRDRATVFVDGAREGAPNARHCADNWHVWHVRRADRQRVSELPRSGDLCLRRHATAVEW
ncbi:transposase [Streptomyces sp. NPDC002742]|uniref:transposase n=1 Tax=Streptomyces sp. NPDC002742 TaxID=3364663 RepID=UPI0036A260A8